MRFAKQAVRADPTLAPGVVALADALNAAGKARAARRALLAGWKAQPHPLIAQAWFAPVATPIERAQAAAELAAANPGHAESELVLGETALAARLTGEARRHAEAAIAAGATDARADNILAALEASRFRCRPVRAGCAAPAIRPMTVGNRPVRTAFGRAA